MDFEVLIIISILAAVLVSGISVIVVHRFSKKPSGEMGIEEYFDMFDELVDLGKDLLELNEDLQAIKGDDVKVKQYFIEHIREIIEDKVTNTTIKNLLLTENALEMVYNKVKKMMEK